MTAINFPNSPAEGDYFTSGIRTWRYRNGQWALANTIGGLESAFRQVNTANTQIQWMANAFTGKLSNTANIWYAGNLLIRSNTVNPGNVANLRILGNTTLGALDTFKVELAASQTGNAMNVRQRYNFDDGLGDAEFSNNVMKLQPNGTLTMSIALGFEPNGHSEMIVQHWYVEKLTQDFATAATGNNRTGLKILGAPNRWVAFKIYASVLANVGGDTGTTGVNYGYLLSSNVYNRGSLTWHPTGITTMSYMAPTANTGQISNGAQASVPRQMVPMLIHTVGIVQFAPNTANNPLGSEAEANLEVTLGTETASNGVVLLANSFITYTVLPWNTATS